MKLAQLQEAKYAIDSQEPRPILLDVTNGEEEGGFVNTTVLDSPHWKSYTWQIGRALKNPVSLRDGMNMIKSYYDESVRDLSQYYQDEDDRFEHGGDQLESRIGNFPLAAEEFVEKIKANRLHKYYYDESGPPDDLGAAMLVAVNNDVLALFKTIDFDDE